MNHKVAFSFADGKTLFFPVQGNEILLDAALRNGIKIPLDCREGVCGTCMGRCESGSYAMDYADEETLSAEDLAQRKILSCQTRVQSDAAFYFDFDSSLCSAAGPATRGTAVALATSTFAAKPGARAMSFSPAAHGAMNSCAPEPPIIPTSDSTMYHSSPARVKIFLYASACTSYDSARPSMSRSKE